MRTIAYDVIGVNLFHFILFMVKDNRESTIKLVKPVIPTRT